MSAITSNSSSIPLLIPQPHTESASATGSSAGISHSFQASSVSTGSLIVDGKETSSSKSSLISGTAVLTAPASLDPDAYMKSMSKVASGLTGGIHVTSDVTAKATEKKEGLEESQGDAAVAASSTTEATVSTAPTTISMTEIMADIANLQLSLGQNISDSFQATIASIESSANAAISAANESIKSANTAFAGAIGSFATSMAFSGASVAGMGSAASSADEETAAASTQNTEASLTSADHATTLTETAAKDPTPDNIKSAQTSIHEAEKANNAPGIPSGIKESNQKVIESNKAALNKLKEGSTTPSAPAEQMDGVDKLAATPLHQSEAKTLAGNARKTQNETKKSFDEFKAGDKTNSAAFTSRNTSQSGWGAVFQSHAAKYTAIGQIGNSASGLISSSGQQAAAVQTAAAGKDTAASQAASQAVSTSSATTSALLQTADSLRSSASAVANAMATMASGVRGAS